MKLLAVLACPILATLALATAIPPSYSPVGTITDAANLPLNRFLIYYAAGFNPWRTPVGYIVRTSDDFPDGKYCPDRFENIDPETPDGAFPDEGILVTKDGADGTTVLEMNVKSVGHYRIREEKAAGDGKWRLEDRQGRSAGRCKRLTTGPVSRCKTDNLKWIVQLHYDCTLTRGVMDAAAEMAAVGDSA